MKNSCKLCELISNTKYINIKKRRRKKEKKEKRRRKKREKEVHTGKGSVEPSPTILACFEEKSASADQ